MYKVFYLKAIRVIALIMILELPAARFEWFFIVAS